ncbi:AVAST type 1 anti-phage system protease Avs1b [Undibacterium sp. Xuan67W]|uniref:AVAST type 1 anti-phage system protease Avs1b n=1 Tax=Undibacterium sp. Xuan67W TaxID=3413057 RepID=UPI003BF05F1C
MLENLIKLATCKVRCGIQEGTGQLVTPTSVLTARHCAQSAFDTGESVTLSFFIDGEQRDVLATVIADAPEFDACLLQLSESIDIRPIPLSADLPDEGIAWMSFGFPKLKNNIGHRANGTVSQMLLALNEKMDIDLSVESSVTLSNYEGMSGAGVFINGVCKGLVRLEVDLGLGAISVSQMRDFLVEHDVPVLISDNHDAGDEPRLKLAPRTVFATEFESALIAAAGGYIFLEGAHGIGKTTFCSTFKPQSENLTVLGAYSLTAEAESLGAAQKAQPEVFVRWLETVIAELLTSKPERNSERTYAQLIELCSSMLREFGSFCGQQGKQGILFIDGVNEAQAAGADALARLIGLLPTSLPSTVTIVLTAPNFSVVAPVLTGRVRSEAVVALPLLTDEVAREYCVSHPALKGASSALVAGICAKAKGHPLYLRYVIEYVAVSGEHETLDDFPDFSGIIEDYYEVLWSRLQSDADAVALLATMARLRTGIPLEEFTLILSQPEKSAFVSVISRIWHLLLRPSDSTIYHPSFGNFLISKTIFIEAATHERVGDFCSRHPEKKYCIINLVFHLLRSNDAHRALAISRCTQEWVDSCVTFGAEADTLLYDVDEVIAVAAESARAVDVVRVLLLSQRMRFRYNVLFAQSAAQVAEALIALNRPDDAYSHVVRFGVLACPVDVALRLAYDLIQSDSKQVALRLLTLTYDKISESYEASEISIIDYFTLVELDLRCLYLMHRADGMLREQQLHVTLRNAMQTIKATFSDSESAAQSAMRGVLASLFSTIITLGAQYSSLLRFYRSLGEAPEKLLDIFAVTVLKTADLSKEYRIPIANCCPPTIFKEMEVLSTAGMEVHSEYILNLLDVLIRCGAPVDLIEKLATGQSAIASGHLALKDKDGVNFDFDEWFQATREWRVSSFLTIDDECPQVKAFTNNEWASTFDGLVRVLSWCEGKAIRAIADKDEVQAQSILELIRERVLNPLEFTLAQRVEWERSYFIPEDLVPLIYERIVEIYLVCFPGELGKLLQILRARMPSQCGVYSEGFIRILDLIVESIAVHGASDEVADGAFEILKYRKDYVLRNVKNRHELVPELLRIIPALVHCDANELASSVYQQMLNVSMGPSWYKEDQFGLLNSAVRSAPPSSDLVKLLPQVAGYLEAASGEMTFQRFVRYDKSAFLKGLFEHGYSVNGANYFKRQTCGEIKDLFAEASQGDMDRAGPFAGGRYPGMALDEQASILDMVSGASSADWRIRWALLEVYQYGDERHVPTYANEYAKLLNTHEANTVDFADALERLSLLITEELPQKEQSNFVAEFMVALAPKHAQTVAAALAKLEIPTDPAAKKTQTRSEHKEPVTNEGITVGKPDRDFVIPGRVGTSSSYRAAAALLAQAQSQLGRGNARKAQDLAVQVLRQIQMGSGSIWAGEFNDGEVRRAQEILLSNSKTADELVSHYGSLILSEDHVARWRVAEHLIEAIAPIATAAESMNVVRCAIEHVALIVGDAAPQISEYGFLSTETRSDVSDVLFDLLLWLTDHPTWLRREKAGEMLFWILNRSDQYLKKAVEAAFSMTPGFAGDVVGGVLDCISRRKPVQFWDALTSTITVSDVVTKLRHVGRISTLLNFAEHSAERGSTSAMEACKEIHSILNAAENSEVKSVGGALNLPEWADSIREPWQKLQKMGVVDGLTLSRLVESMGSMCLPLDVQIAWLLERQVSKSFGVLDEVPMSRWGGKARFALGLAVLPNVTSKNINSVAAVLRVCNPSSMADTRQASNTLRSLAIRVGLDERTTAAITGFGSEYFLHYREIFQHQGRMQTIEITAVMTSDYDGHNVKLPTDAALFDSFELAAAHVDLGTHDTCYRVRPKAGFLGTFTPAYPQPGFVKLLGAAEADFSRVNWKHGRSAERDTQGLPIYEGSMLTIKRSAVRRIRPGWGLAWIISLNGRHLASIRDNFNEGKR